jgi:hypothetical protein
MRARLAELLLKAVRHLPPDEQEEVLADLLGTVVSGTVNTADATPATIPTIDPLPIGATGSVLRSRSGLRRDWAVRIQPISALDPLGGSEPGEAETALKVLPVRLPVTDYERLRAFSREHGFSMAVIIRTLVERFLDGQAQRSASPQGDGPDAALIADDEPDPDADD